MFNSWHLPRSVGPNLGKQLTNFSQFLQKSAERATKNGNIKKNSLVFRLYAQALLISSPEVREKLILISNALDSHGALQAFGNISERWARVGLPVDGLNILGAYLRGERQLPSESNLMSRARSALEEAREIIEEESRTYDERNEPEN